MELRSCANTHFIQAIRAGAVIKVPNIDSNGRPALVFKTLLDIYASEDAKKLGRHPTSDSHKVHTGFAYEYEHGKCEIPCSPVVHQARQETVEFFPLADDGSDLDDDPTLKQLKEKSLTKKRKFNNAGGNSNQAHVNEKPVKDEPDLDEPLINWKSKKPKNSKVKRKHRNGGAVFSSHNVSAINSGHGLTSESSLQVAGESAQAINVKVEVQEVEELGCQSNTSSTEDSFLDHDEGSIPQPLDEPLINWKSKKPKNSKVKRKHRNGGAVFSSHNVGAIKSGHGLTSESSLQVAGESAQVISVKVEVQEVEESGCQSKTSSTEDSSLDHDEGPSPGGVVSNNSQKIAQCENEEPISSAEENPICVTNEISYDHLEDVQSSPEENQICVTDEISYDHLEDVQPTSILFPCDEMRVQLEIVELDCHEFLDLPTLAIEMGGKSMEAHSCHFSSSKEQNSDASSHPGNSSSTEEISEQSSNSDVQVPGMCLNGSIDCMGLFEDKSKADLLHGQDDSLSSPDKKHDSSRDSCILLKTNDNLDEEQTLSSNLGDIKKIGLKGGDHMEDELLNLEEKQTSASSITDVAQSYPTAQTSDNAETSASPELCQPPEKWLHPKRKAISPSSQERLCSAMNSVELSDDIEEYICKEKLFEKQSCKKVSPVRLNIQQVTVNHGVPRQISQRKIITTPRRAMKKSQNAKGNLEGPRSSSTRINLSTGCTSIQGCSESVIAFSQRQMNDMETLAGKLMNELNSLKDIVEQKLLFEAYRSVSVKHDADEVKSVIKNATKVEEGAQKWLTMMSRDCNRFCKIMKLSAQSVPGPVDSVPRNRKKIMFADEAGGKLCHVKFFEVDPTPEVSDAENKSSN